MPSLLRTLFFLSLVLILSCHEKNNGGFYWKNYTNHRDGEYLTVDTNDIFGIDSSRSGNTLSLTYFSKRDTVRYTISNNAEDSQEVFHSRMGRRYMHKLSDTNLLIDNKSYVISKYIMQDTNTNRIMMHYYTPDFGFFAIMPPNRPGLRVLQSSNPGRNELLTTLVSRSVPSSYLLSNFK